MCGSQIRSGLPNQPTPLSPPCNSGKCDSHESHCCTKPPWAKGGGWKLGLFLGGDGLVTPNANKATSATTANSSTCQFQERTRIRTITTPRVVTAGAAGRSRRTCVARMWPNEREWVGRTRVVQGASVSRRVLGKAPRDFSSKKASSAISATHKGVHVYLKGCLKPLGLHNKIGHLAIRGRAVPPGSSKNSSPPCNSRHGGGAQSLKSSQVKNYSPNT